MNENELIEIIEKQRDDISILRFAIPYMQHLKNCMLIQCTKELCSNCEKAKNCKYYHSLNLPCTCNYEKIIEKINK